MDSSDQSRWKFGLRSMLGGALAIVVVTAIAIFSYADAAAVGTAVGPAIAAIGALTGAYFGIQAGSAGREAADASRNEAHVLALKFAAVADPDRALAVLNRGSGGMDNGAIVHNLTSQNSDGPDNSDGSDDEVGGLRGIGL